jgi:hypothetical protein
LSNIYPNSAAAFDSASPIEEWRPVIGFEGLYEVSNHGRVKGLARKILRRNGRLQSIPETILRPQRNSRHTYHHVKVGLSKVEKKTVRYVHRMVLEAFVGPCPEGMQCRHLNGNARDNRLVNLIWGTPQENMNDKRRHGTQPVGEQVSWVKLTKWNVLIDVPLMTARGWLQRKIGAELGVAQSTVHEIITGKKWKHLLHLPPPTFTPEIEAEYVAIRGQWAA